MKKILVATAVALALSATAANAASTAVLKVTGLLSVAACTPQLSGGGEVDYGLIHWRISPRPALTSWVRKISP